MIWIRCVTVNSLPPLFFRLPLSLHLIFRYFLSVNITLLALPSLSFSLCHVFLTVSPYQYLYSLCPCLSLSLSACQSLSLSLYLPMYQSLFLPACQSLYLSSFTLSLAVPLSLHVYSLSLSLPAYLSPSTNVLLFTSELLSFSSPLAYSPARSLAVCANLFLSACVCVSYSLFT